MKLKLFFRNLKSLETFWTNSHQNLKSANASWIVINDLKGPIHISKDRIHPWIEQSSDLTVNLTTAFDTSNCTLSDPTNCLFDVSKFFHIMNERNHAEDTQMVGDKLLYAPEVGSTQTLLEDRPAFSRLLDHGTVFFADCQTAGKGRMGSKWISDNGCLQFSMLICYQQPQLQRSGTGSGSGSPVFVQYLMALCIVESIIALRPQLKDSVKIKWPNDIYAKFPGSTGDGKFVKMGGILINSTYEPSSPAASAAGHGPLFRMILGCGLNVYNETEEFINLKRICEDDELLSTGVSREELLAEIMTRFDVMYTHQYSHHGFTQFFNRFYAHWLHSDQIVKVSIDYLNNNSAASNENENNCEITSAKIVGISESSGFLLAVDQQGAVYELYPEGTSFDLTQGFIGKKKSTFNL